MTLIKRHELLDFVDFDQLRAKITKTISEKDLIWRVDIDIWYERFSFRLIRGARRFRIDKSIFALG